MKKSPFFQPTAVNLDLEQPMDQLVNHASDVINEYMRDLSNISESDYVKAEFKRVLDALNTASTSQGAEKKPYYYACRKFYLDIILQLTDFDKQSILDESHRLSRAALAKAYSTLQPFVKDNVYVQSELEKIIIDLSPRSK